MGQPQISLEKPDGKPASPWQVASTGGKTSLKDVLNEPPSSTPSPTAIPSRTLDTPAPSKPLTPRRTASPDTRFAGQNRVSNKSIPKTRPVANGSPQSATSSSSKGVPIVPHSKSYIQPAGKAEPSLQLSMADIIGQEQRAKEVIKEAVAKRSLQEIQEEQAFQEWWDQESRRAQEEEAARAKTTASGPGREGKSGGSRAKSGGRGWGSKGRGDAAQRGAGRSIGQEKKA